MLGLFLNLFTIYVRQLQLRMRTYRMYVVSIIMIVSTVVERSLSDLQDLLVFKIIFEIFKLYSYFICL